MKHLESCPVLHKACVLVVFVCLQPCLYAQVPESERNALIAFYESTGGPQWFSSYNWLGPPGTEGTWGGVTVEGGHVTELSLRGKRLVGTLPNEIGDLRFLKNLRLHAEHVGWGASPPNELTGPIPSTIGHLSYLEYFDIDGNEITEVPNEIMYLDRLKVLNLSRNRLTRLPAGIGDLESLEELWLSSNELSSLPREIGGLSDLTHLNLWNNQLTAIPPEIGYLSSLISLSLGYNPLTTLPDSMSHLANLTYLSLGNNPMPQIPPVVGRMPALQHIRFWELANEAIPPGIDVAQQIKKLTVDGRISVWPEGLFSLVNLEELDLSGNDLDHISPELGNLVNLRELSLHNNSFSGPIPPELGKLIKLEELLLDNRRLSGTLPPELANMTALQKLEIRSTDISGPIPPEFGNFQNLHSLELVLNELDGEIPAELGNLTTLWYLDLARNNLEGTIPPELGNLIELGELDLGFNRLTGRIPSELGNLVHLESLSLYSNKLSGPIPVSLMKLRHLRSGGLGRNALYADDPELRTFLRVAIGDFEKTQTIAPDNLAIPEISGTSVLLTWDPIRFQDHEGSYEFFLGTTPRDPYEFIGKTENKAESSIKIGGLDVGTKYHLVVRTVTDSQLFNPNRVISEFSPELEVTTGTAHDLYFPLLVSDAKSFTGLAVSNNAPVDTMLEFKAFDSAGNMIPGTSNPSLRPIEGRAHLARLGSQIFGYKPWSEQHGWALLTAETSPIGNLFLIGGYEKLDGGPAFTLPARHLYFTRALVPASLWAGEQGSAEVALANPSLKDVSVELTLWGDKHAPGKNTRNRLKIVREIPPMGLLLENVSTLFGDHGFQSGALEVEVKSGEGVTGFGVLESCNGSTIVGLNPTIDPGYTQLYSAQFAAGPSLSTSLKLINTASEARQMTVRVIGDDGSELAKAYQGELPSNDYFEKDVSEIFGFSQPRVVGSIIVTVDKPGVIGDVIIGELQSLRYASSLSLQGRLFKEAIFSQVANTPYLFTGLALMNPQGEAADVTIEVFSSYGEATGQASFKLPGGHRLSKLLFDLVPETRNQVEGYFVVRSSQPLAGQQIFGDYRQTFFAAVPPKIQGPYTRGVVQEK